jgi:hypothetical protein
MKLLQTIVFFGLYGLTSASLPEGSHPSMAEPEEHGSVRKRALEEQKASKPNIYRRRNKKNKGGKKGGGGNFPDGAFGQNHACVPFENIEERVIRGTTPNYDKGITGGDVECLDENACTGGCCRIFNSMMICDLVGGDNYFTLPVRDNVVHEHIGSFFDNTPLSRR